MLIDLPPVNLRCSPRMVIQAPAAVQAAATIAPEVTRLTQVQLTTESPPRRTAIYPMALLHRLKESHSPVRISPTGPCTGKIADPLHSQSQPVGRDRFDGRQLMHECKDPNSEVRAPFSYSVSRLPPSKTKPMRPRIPRPNFP